MSSALRCHGLKLQAVVLLAFGCEQAALSLFERLLQRQPLDRYALASRAHVLAKLNHMDEAIASLQLLTAAWPQEAAGWFNLGFVLQQGGRHDEAGAAFRSALECDARLDRAWYGLALVLMQQRQFQQALEALKQTTALQPLGPHGWYRMVQVRQALGQPEEARLLIEHLRRFEPRVAAQLERETGLGHGVTPSAMCDAAH